MLVALALLVAGFATSGLKGTLALTSHLSAQATQTERPSACAGFVLSGATAGCLTVTSVVCNPAGTVDPQTGVRVAADRIRATALTPGYDSVTLILTGASTAVNLRRGSESASLHGAAVPHFGVATGVSADQDLSDDATAAASHLKGSVACL